MLKTRNGKEIQDIKREAEAEAREKARQSAEAARAKAKQEKETAEKAKKESEALAKAKAKQEADATRERALQAKKAEKTAKMAAAWVKKELEADNKRKAKQEAEAAKKAKEAAVLAKRQTETAAREKAKQEAEAAKKAKEAAVLAKRQADSAARQKALQEAEAQKKSHQVAALVKQEADKLAHEKARQEAEALRKSRESAALAKQEADKLAREKAQQEAEALRKSRESAALAKQEADKLAHEKARQDAEALRKSRESAALAKQEADKLAHEKARQEAETLKQAQQAAAMAKKQADELAREKVKQEAEALKKSQQAAAQVIKEAEAIAREKLPQRSETTAKAPETKVRAKKDNDAKPVRAPFFSGRSIMVMIIGLIIGVGLGFGYWVYNPFGSGSTTPETTQPTGLELIGMPDNVPWSSDVKVQLVNPGSSAINLRDLASTGQYYAAKATSLPFLQFLSDSLTVDAPQYKHTTDELDEMITTAYDTTSELPTIILTTTAATSEEASFFSTYIPNVFTQYLIAEEGNKQEQEYQDLSKKVDQVKAALVLATDELNIIKQTSSLEDFNNNAEYVALTAKIAALEAQLESQAIALAANIEIAGDSSQTLQESITQTMEQRDAIITKLTEAQSVLRDLELQISLEDSGVFNAELIQLNAKVDALEIELDKLMLGDSTTVGLVTMIAQGLSATDPVYVNQLSLINKASESLVETRQRIAVIESDSAASSSLALSQDYQLAKAKVDNLQGQYTTVTNKLAALSLQSTSGLDQPSLQESFTRTSTALAGARSELAALESTHSSSSYVSADLDYQLALAKVDTLNKQLASLSASMISLMSNEVDTVGITDSFVAGNPSIPVPVLPEKMQMRNAIMIGAIVGIMLAWGILNFKWLRKSVFSSSKTTNEEDIL